MSDEQRHRQSLNDEDEFNNQYGMEHKISSDSLEFVPTFLKVKQIILLGHKELIALINEFNNTLEAFTRDEPYFLQFTIVPHSDSNIFWKALIRIKCSKVRKETA